MQNMTTGQVKFYIKGFNMIMTKIILEGNKRRAKRKRATAI